MAWFILDEDENELLYFNPDDWKVIYGRCEE